MKKIAEFLVTRRFAILAVMLVLTAACGFLALRVPINKDRTKYLADDSNMKQGLAVMQSAFAEAEEKSSVRVMFDDLAAEQIDDVRARLEAIPNVSSVAYEAGSAEYNKDNHTLFVVNSTFDYHTDEEAAIEDALKTGFPGLSVTYQNNDMPTTEVPIWLLLTALTLAVIILVIMSPSWLDPVLFLITIGMAVIINFGTNILLPYTDEMTATVGPVLQLVLSMDYSIILMTRYRQEKQTGCDRFEAMKTALAGSISSISSSSLTTVVGLLALVFLSFKLGPELGIVLSKGVFISMLCVFTVLPAMILGADKWLEKTKKWSVRIPMGPLSRFSHRLRYVMPAIFIVLLAGSLVLQNSTDIVFTENSEDVLADIFPKENTAVLIYRNEEEEKIGAIVSALEADERITGILGYSNTLGKEMTADEMSDALGALSGDVRISEDVVRMLYFMYRGGELPSISAADFMKFITESVLPDETLSAFMDDGLRGNVEYLETLSDRDALTAELTAAETAALFGIEEADVKNLYLYYFIRSGVPDSGTMTLTDFTDFVLNTVAADELYGAMFDPAALAGLAQMKNYTDAESVRRERSAPELAALLGLDEGTVKTVFALSSAGDVSGKTMTVSDFSALLCSMAQDVSTGAFLDAGAGAQLQMMNGLISLAVSGQPLSAGEMAQTLGLEEETVAMLYRLCLSSDPNFQPDPEAPEMTLPDFLSFLVRLSPNASTEQAAQLRQINQIIQPAAAGTPLSAPELAQLFGMDEDTAAMLFRLDSGGDLSGKTMSLRSFTDFILSDPLMRGRMDSASLGQLRSLQLMINASVNGTEFTSEALASLLGMEPSQAEQLYILKMSGDASWKLSPQQFVSFAAEAAVESGDSSDSFDKSSADDLKRARALIEAVVSGETYSVGEMSELLQSLTDNVSEKETELMYLYYGGVNDTDSATKMTIPQLFDYLCNTMLNDVRFDDYFDAETRADILDSGAMLTDAIAQMKGETYSRLVLTSDYPDESPETQAYTETVRTLCEENLGEYYLVGSSAMVSEMSGTFHKEYIMITLITAIAIFLVVLLTFRNLVFPLILTLIVQCGVFITVAVIGAYSGSIYYLALLIVQSILMGATIDYGIVFCNFYRESRKTMSGKDALKAAYEGSIHTVMTSGAILVLVLASLGIFVSSPMISEVCVTLSIGVFVAILLILFVLPGMVACCDRLAVKKPANRKRDGAAVRRVV